MSNTNPLKTASVLAFERKLDPSDALFFSGRWEKRSDILDWPAVQVREKSVRGTISNRLKTKDSDPAKLDAAIQNPNLQTVDVATLPSNADTLKVCFTLRVLGGAGIPSACNSSEYRAKLMTAVRGYADKVGFDVLAQRYATNLANGRFLWRNRIGAEEIEVVVSQWQQGQSADRWFFNAFKVGLNDFETIDDSQREDIQALGSLISTGLAGEKYLLLQVTAFVRIGDGQEVFPSQELILDKESKERAAKSKTLYTVGGIAGIHSQKIGNAIRTIDTWYPNYNAEGLGPIAVEPYGSVTTLGHACRQPKDKMDFYSLLDNWLIKDKDPKEQQHYVMATLIRGGVFGEKE